MKKLVEYKIVFQAVCIFVVFSDGNPRRFFARKTQSPPFFRMPTGFFHILFCFFFFSQSLADCGEGRDTEIRFQGKITVFFEMSRKIIRAELIFRKQTVLAKIVRPFFQ